MDEMLVDQEDQLGLEDEEDEENDTLEDNTNTDDEETETKEEEGEGAPDEYDPQYLAGEDLIENTVDDLASLWSSIETVTSENRKENLENREECTEEEQFELEQWEYYEKNNSVDAEEWIRVLQFRPDSTKDPLTNMKEYIKKKLQGQLEIDYEDEVKSVATVPENILDFYELAVLRIYFVRADDKIQKIQNTTKKAKSFTYVIEIKIR